MLTKKDGEMAVKLARNSIEECLRNGKKLEPLNLKPIFNEKRGVFVTLHKEKELRGCIGRPYPVLPLSEAIIVSAINSAKDDPRFYPVELDELDEVSIEVTILTNPELIKSKPKELPEKIIIGKDGLIIAQGVCRGLLLPQVAIEHGFDCTEFLCQTCVKAGLKPNAWLKGAEVYKFQGQIFEEIEPNGEIKEKLLC